MGQTLENLVTTTHVAEVVHHGEKLVVPENMDIDDAIRVLERRKEYLFEVVAVSESFNVFPWDGAFALSQVLIKRYGWAEGKPIRTFFGDIKPKLIKVAISPTEKADVPWGLFSLPNVAAKLTTGHKKRSDGLVVFQITCEVMRRDMAIIQGLFDDLREYIRTHSLYRGKAIKLRFMDHDGDKLELPEPEFIDVSKTNPEGLIFSRDLMASIKANLFTPIERVDDCLQNGIKVKRGVILGGKYGTGKTLAASVAARLAQDNGITYVYTPRASELGEAIDFARQYQSPACVVFCEDIDRQVHGERTVEMDEILNILDGIDTKNDNIITVLTTNHLENINKAMLRPGRLDAIINVTPPDAKAAEKLVRFYGGISIAEDEDLTEVGEALAGQIPAIIEETVKRAKLFQLALSGRGHAITGLTNEALRQASVTMKSQIELLNDTVKEPPVRMEDILLALMAKAVHGNYSAKEMKKLNQIVEYVS